MERELESLIAIKKLPRLVEKDFQVMYLGRSVWTILSESFVCGWNLLRDR
jgi:hypothetical protein